MCGIIRFICIQSQPSDEDDSGVGGGGKIFAQRTPDKNQHGKSISFTWRVSEMSPAPLSECKRRINTSDSLKDNFIHKKEEAAAKLGGMFKDPLFTAEAQVDRGQQSSVRALRMVHPRRQSC